MDLIPGETLLAHLFVLRFPILTAVLLVALPLIALRLAKPLLANLFDLTPLKAVAVTIAACVMAWTALFSGWVVMSYGPSGLESRICPSSRRRKCRPGPSFGPLRPFLYRCWFRLGFIL
jgi:hypothetical protein